VEGGDPERPGRRLHLARAVDEDGLDPRASGAEHVVHDVVPGVQRLVWRRAERRERRVEDPRIGFLRSEERAREERIEPCGQAEALGQDPEVCAPVRHEGGAEVSGPGGVEELEGAREELERRGVSEALEELVCQGGQLPSREPEPAVEDLADERFEPGVGVTRLAFDFTGQRSVHLAHEHAHLGRVDRHPPCTGGARVELAARRRLGGERAAKIDQERAEGHASERVGRRRALAMRRNSRMPSVLPPKGFVLVLALVCAASSCRTPPAGDRPREAARIATDVGDWPRAAALWHELWQHSGHLDPEAAREAARAIAATGDRAGAKALLRSQLARGGDDAAASSQLGALELADGEHDRARASFERGRALAPGDTRAAVALAQLYRLTGEDARALATVQGATRYAAAMAALAAEAPTGAGAPSSVGARAEGAGSAAVGPKGGAAAARAAARDAASEAALERDSALALGRVSLRLGRYAEALAAFERAYADPGQPVVPADALALASAFLTAGEGQWPLAASVLGWLQRARAAEPNRSDLPLASARLYDALGRPEDAAQAARSAVELDPGDVDALVLLVTSLRAAGRVDEAERVLAHGFALDLDSAERARLVALK
jgi:tetratricopeptide (TPR) repeat protein